MDKDLYERVVELEGQDLSAFERLEKQLAIIHEQYDRSLKLQVKVDGVHLSRASVLKQE